jgi:hypothetical protein
VRLRETRALVLAPEWEKIDPYQSLNMAEFIQGTKPKGVFTKKAINIASQDIIYQSYRHF